jgi:hypothetical protein
MRERSPLEIFNQNLRQNFIWAQITLGLTPDEVALIVKGIIHRLKIEEMSQEYPAPASPPASSDLA